MADDSLKFGLSLDVNTTEFEQEWKEKQKEIQKIIDQSAFKIKIDGVEGLDKIKKQLEDISKLQKEMNLSPYKAGKLAQMPAVAAAKESAKWNAKSALTEQQVRTEMERTSATAALKAKRQLELNNATMKGVSATNAQTAAYRTQSGVLNGLKQFMNSYISLLGGYRLVNNIKQITSEFELQRVSLRAITQDAQFADALFAKIKATAVESPFATKELVTYTKQLAAYRIENEELYDTMNMLADVSAGLGVSMDRLILAYGQVKAASVLRGTELRQFTEAGIPLVDELAKKFSQLRGEVVSTGEVFDLISTRQVPFEMVADIFKEMTAEGGRFYEMQKKQSESLYGVFENLKDNIQNAYDEIGQSNRGLLMGIGKMATAVAKNLSVITGTLTPLVAGWGAYVIAMKLVGTETSRSAVATALLNKAQLSLASSTSTVGKLNHLHASLLQKARAANNRYAIATLNAAAANNAFARTFYKLQAALIANPVIAVISATTAIVAGSIALWNKYKDSLSSTAKSNERVAKSVEDIQRPLKDATKSYDAIIKRIKEYDILLKTQGKSLTELKRIYPAIFSQYKTDEERQKAVAEATKKRIAAVNELKALSPDILSSINSETVSVQQLAAAWGDVTQAMRDNEVESLEAKKSNTEALLQKAKRDLEVYRERMLNAPDESTRLSFLGAMEAEELRIEGLEKDLAGYTRELEALTKANKDAAAAQLLWRQEYNKFMKGGTLKDQELAALEFADTIKETRNAWKDATDRAKEYQDAIDAAKTQKQTDEVRKNVEEYKKQLATQQQIIKNAESYAKFAGFSLSTEKDTTPIDNLKSELSLVEKIYKRYGELRKLMSDEAAKADIEEIYGGLTNVDFLSPEKLRTRLQKMLEQAEQLGDKDLAIQLGLKIQDIDTNEIKDKLEKALSRLSNQIKQQQDASEFFEKMLGLTGDTELSTKLTLAVTGINLEEGGVGELLSSKLSEILQIPSVAEAVPVDFLIDGKWNSANVAKAIREGEITVAQIQEIIQNLTATGKTELATVLEESLASFINYNKGLINEIYSTIGEYSDFADKIKLVMAQTDITSKVRPPEIDDAAWEAYKAALQRKQDESVASINFDKFKQEFAKQLSNLDIVASASLNAIRQKLVDWMTENSGKASEADMKAVLELIEKIDNIKVERNPFKEWVAAWKELQDAKAKGDPVAIEEAFLKLKSVSKVSSKAIANMADTITNTIDSALGLADALGITFSDDTLEVINAFKNGLKLVAPIMTAVGVAMIFTNNAANALQISLWPLLLVTLALAAAFAAISWISGAKVRAANKEIEKQEKILKNLERAYDRLEEVQEQLVGSDWVKNQQQQILNLQKQISAFQAQRDAEESKGKKKDEDAIEDYTDKILDAQEQMRELQRGIAKEMSGTDLSSAAKDFAQSWLDAYLSFDDTMGALKSSFKDMMSTMVQNSMMAKLVQKRLEPVFNAIDKAYEDAELTPTEWQSIMDMGNRAIEYIDEDLTHLAEMLGLREQLGTQQASDLTGIAKGVAQASEETVLTLAGYANSILYYQIWLKNDVAAIRAILEGKVAAVSPATANEGGFNVGQLVTLQQQSLSQLQAINENTGRSADSLSRIEDKLDSVISAQGTSARKVLNTRLSN